MPPLDTVTVPGRDPLTTNVPPLVTLQLPLADREPPFAITSLPPLTVVPPEKLFVLERVRVPVPLFDNPTVPKAANPVVPFKTAPSTIDPEKVVLAVPVTLSIATPALVHL